VSNISDSAFALCAIGTTFALTGVGFCWLFVRDRLKKHTSRGAAGFMAGAWLLFTASFFAPSLHAGSDFYYGWECALLAFCESFKDTFVHSIVNSIDFAKNLSSTLANLAMIASPIWVLFMQFRSRRKKTILVPLSSVPIAASWAVHAYAEGSLRDLKLGYWMWLCSFALLAFALILDYLQARRKETACAPTPLSASPAAGPGRTSGCSSTSAA